MMSERAEFCAQGRVGGEAEELAGHLGDITAGIYVATFAYLYVVGRAVATASVTKQHGASHVKCFTDS